MTTVIELEDINVESLSNETLDIISKLVAAVKVEGGYSFSFTDPYLLTKLRRAVRKLKNPQVNALYFQFKYELRRSVNKGHFKIRPYRITASTPGRFTSRFANRLTGTTAAFA